MFMQLVFYGDKLKYISILSPAGKVVISLFGTAPDKSIIEAIILGVVNVLKFCTPKCMTKWHMQTVQTQIRLLLKKQSDQGLHCLPFQLVC